MRHLPLLLVLILAGLVLGEVVTYDFVSWDDDVFFYQNPLLRPLSSESLKAVWTAPYARLYAPVTYTAWMGLTALASPQGAADPWVYHLASLLAHLLTVGLAYTLLWRLLTVGRERSSVGRGLVPRRAVVPDHHSGGVRAPALQKRSDAPAWAAAAGAAIFALHPLQVESVAWASELKDLLGGLFGLLAVLLVVMSRQTGRRWLYGLASLSFVLAILSKPNLVTVPLLLFVLDWRLLQTPVRRAALTVAPWLAVGLGLAVLTRGVQPPAPELIFPLWQRFFIAGDALAFYLGKAVLPAQMTADYGRTPHLVVSHWWGYVTWLAPVLALAIAWKLRHRAEWLLTGLLWFGLALLPILGLLPFDFQQYATVADHYAYLAVFGLALIVSGVAVPGSAAILAASGRSLAVRRYLPVALLLIIALLCAQSALQVMTWRDSGVFWRHTLEVNPRSSLAHNNLGAVHQMAGRLDLAAAEYEAALQLEPDDPDATVNLGMILMRLGRKERAREYLGKGLQLRPGDVKAIMLLAMLDAEAGRHEAALSRWGQMLASNPNDLTALLEAARSHAALEQTAEARRLLERVLQLQPGNQRAQEQLRMLSTPNPQKQ